MCFSLRRGYLLNIYKCPKFQAGVEAMLYILSDVFLSVPLVWNGRTDKGHHDTRHLLYRPPDGVPGCLQLRGRRN